MSEDHTFGSGDLTPELVRGAHFEAHDGRYDAAEVRAFLDNVASSLEVFLAGDAQEALRLEFARNAEIAQQVLTAGQLASEQLRRQAAEDAKQILADTRSATDQLRQDVETDLEGSRRQVVELRGKLMDDLRDLHDRIGASLYRFERAVQEQDASTAAMGEQRSAPEAAAAPAPAAVPAPTPEPEPAPAPAPEMQFEAVHEPAPMMEPIEVAPEIDIPDIAPAATVAPAWTQLPPEIAVATPDVPSTLEPVQEDPVDTSAPLSEFLVTEDQPLAPGEPLVDLREFGTEDDARAEALIAQFGSAPADEPSAPPVEEIPDVSGDALGGDWLSGGAFDAPALDEPVALDPTPQPDHAPMPGVLPPSTPPPAAAPAASPDALAVRQLILESISAGQSRESIETYLREQMGFFEPSSLVDAALASLQQD